jgi:pterin-4a-carbinolamine dehydratase
MAGENKTALSDAQVDAELQTLEGWTRSETVLARHFVFHTFEEITAFLTHLVRAITRADIEFAGVLNAWAFER